MREIKEGLRRSKQREQYEINTAEAVRYRDIHRAILDYEPNIVHFSGHGISSQGRGLVPDTNRKLSPVPEDAAEQEGLVFEDETGQAKLVDAEALAGLFELFADQVKCVVLNACYSEIQAQAIAQHINYVIGMSQAIGDRAAIEFAVGFYDALGAGRPVDFAYRLGCSVIRIAGILENLTPQLLTKNHAALVESKLPSVKPSPSRTVAPYPSPPATPPPKPKQEVKLPVFEFDVMTVDGTGQIVKREQGRARYFTEDLGNNVILDMVFIPGGSFMMGSPEGEEDSREKPQHEVTVQPFFMGKYPVTQAQWRAIASLPKVNRNLNPEPSRFKGDERPVEQVSWDDAVEFCERLSRETGREYRLPSEAEWEYACRAGTTTPYHFGETISREVANCKRNVAIALMGLFVGETTEVGSFKVSNAFGLYDMHGNVWEWCEDYWHKNYEGAPTDGSAWSSETSNTKVLRGGSWYVNPLLCRSACRLDFSRDDRNYSFGFRVVCVVPRTTK